MEYVYVIVQVQPKISFKEQSYQIIGVTKSYDTACQYAGTNRFIKGPIPILDLVGFDRMELG